MGIRPKCLLLPIDGTNESLRPITFISRLYPVSEVSLILCYFSPPPPPVYFGAAAETLELRKKKWDLALSRQQDARRIFVNAKEVLLKAGFSEELIQEHIQQREMSVAKHACLLADIRKVDAVVIQKRVSSSLEGFIMGDTASALLQYCLTSPVWFVEGEINPKSAAICIVDEDASLRIADHAGYMLPGSVAEITLLQAVRKLSAPISFRPSDGLKEPAGHAGMSVSPGRYAYLLRAADILKDYGIDESRIQITLIPDRGDIAGEILSWCSSNGIGIVGLGHSEPEGIWSALKTSVTRKILSDFKNMAVWVAQ
ncbi:MAG: universal stress protein [Syntrophobacteraceae bacterium]|jgi:nucleotide-binding universal stress UspA family protein